MINNQLYKKLIWPCGMLLTAMILMVGCNAIGSNDHETKQLKISMSAGESAVSHSKTHTTTWDTNKVELTEVKLLVHEFELKTISQDSLDFEIYDLVIDLPLDGDTLEIANEQIPAGDYNKVDIEIDKADINDPDLSDSTGHHSIVVYGTYNGEEFTFRTNREFKESFKFNPPIEVADTTTSVNLHLSIDIDRWFKHADPTNPEHQHKIEHNIEKSFKAHCWYRGGSPWWGHGNYWNK